MTTLIRENTNKPSINLKIQKSDEINCNMTSKIDNVSKLDTSLKKLYLPTIQKKTTQTIPVSSLTKRIQKSNSQPNLLKKNFESDLMSPSTEKEKILFAKYSLSRINAKINDITLSYKRLLAEKEENLNIIKRAICSDDPTYVHNLYSKIEQFLEDTIKNNSFNSISNKKTYSTLNNENTKYTEEKIGKFEETKEKENKTINKDEGENINIKNNVDIDKEVEKEEKKEEQKNNSEQKDENNPKQNINNINEEAKNKELNNNEVQNNNNENNNNSNEIQNRHNYSLETRAEEINKMNSFNNSHLQNSSLNNINANNSLEEQIKCIKEIIEEKDEEKVVKEPEKTVQIESGLFEKSSVPTRLFNILKVKSELSALKHKLINIQQKIKLKDEEIDDIKSKAKMKNIIFQKNLLNSKMIVLNKIITKNKEIEEISLPNKNLKIETLKKELKYYNDINKTYIVGNKDVEEDYHKKKSEYEEKSKNCNNLEAKNNNLKYKYNSLRLSDLRRKVDLEKMKGKISQIDEIKQIIQNNKNTIEVKKKEIEEARKILDAKIDEYNKNRENKENKYQEMNKLQREINNKINRQKNEVNRIKTEIKDIEKSINKEVEIFHNINKKEKDLVNEMIINKNKMSSEFLKFLKEIQNNDNLKYEQSKKKRFNNIKSGEKITFNIISKIKRKSIKVSEGKSSNENLPLLEEKLEYYLNNKGGKEENKEIEKDETKEEKKEEKKEEEKKEEKKEEEKKEEKKEEEKKEEKIEVEKKEEKKKEKKEKKKKDKKLKEEINEDNIKIEMKEEKEEEKNEKKERKHKSKKDDKKHKKKRKKDE